MRSAFQPSQMMLAEMIAAAAESVHHRPKPRPATPRKPATPVCQFALFISASVWMSLSRRRVASGSSLWPMIRGGMVA